MYGSLHGSPELRTGDGCDDDLDPIARKVRQDADRKGGGKCQSHLYSQPCSSEEITHCHAEDHADDGGSVLPRESFHQESLYQRKEDKTDEVSAGGTGEFAQSSAEGRKYRQSGCAETEIDKEAYCASFYFKQVNGKENGKVRECDRYGAEWERDG